MTTSGGRIKSSQRVYEAIVEKIQSGELKNAVVENDITQLLGVSRTPVREAIARLIVEGWVEVLDNGSKVVCKITVDQAREIFQVRMNLETLLLELAWGEIDLKLVATLREECQAFIDSGDFDSGKHTLANLYEELFKKANNKLLVESIGVLHNKINLIKVEYIDQVKRKSAEEILSLLTTIVDENKDKSIHNLRFYLAASYYRLFGEL
ncbi:GntR family transcriptional regulator [Vibrio sinensis]|uniref:GntR family transcriptional regulator n=1 Tax=Vibrio sinensis TaxID=2302434 RepID=A0A3A6QP60_9VIBR|nr:GntR family transcriptional regulator [Vibrio sinensis]RJX69380.1 GntR family transcriptional regulator [Vibrio sinensis]